MPTIGGKKAAILCLLEILRRYSDIDHPLSMHQLIQYLHKNYGISAERKSVSRNISLLLEMGMDISTYDENHKGYFLREREFDNLELRILIDSVMTSRYIPESDAKRLIHKLESLGSIYFRHQVRHVHSLPSWPHQHNKAFFFNLDLINEAIDLGQKISFTYNQYGTDGRLHPVRRNFIVSPYALIAANTQYYLVANYAKYGTLPITASIRSRKSPFFPRKTARSGSFPIARTPSTSANMPRSIFSCMEVRPSASF